MAKGPESKTPPDAVDILRRRYIAGRPEREISLCEERANAEIAQMIHDARKKAGLTQEELAARIGSTKSVISRLEDADYEGHSLGMLRRIAGALNLRVSLRFEPAGARATRPAKRVAVAERVELMSIGDDNKMKHFMIDRPVKHRHRNAAARKRTVKKG